MVQIARAIPNVSCIVRVRDFLTMSNYDLVANRNEPCRVYVHKQILYVLVCLHVYTCKESWWRFCVVEDKECACVYMREREREQRYKVQRHREYARLRNVYSQMRKTQHNIRWEESALYSHPLSSLSTRHINMGNEEAHKLCLIEYDSMTHTKCQNTQW